MKNITFRELLNLMYDEKPPKLIEYNDREYNFKISDYVDYVKGEYISNVIGKQLLLVEMAYDECITIYDEILEGETE